MTKEGSAINIPASLPEIPLCQCGHSAGEHDAVAARYCRATVSGELPRGCICVPVAGPLHRSAR